MCKSTESGNPGQFFLVLLSAFEDGVVVSLSSSVQCVYNQTESIEMTKQELSRRWQNTTREKSTQRWQIHVRRLFFPFNYFYLGRKHTGRHVPACRKTSFSAVIEYAVIGSPARWHWGRVIRYRIPGRPTQSTPVPGRCDTAYGEIVSAPCQCQCSIAKQQKQVDKIEPNSKSATGN